MQDYVVPLLLGFSFGNLWICTLLVFSLQTTNRSTCGGYLVGRALTIVALSIMVSLLGRVVDIEPGILNLVSGSFLLLFAIYLCATHILSWVPPWKKGGSAHPSHDSCDGNCDSCPTHHHAQFAEACRSCGDDSRLCAAEEPEFEELTRRARSLRGKRAPENRTKGFLTGFVLGSLRGAALCSKLTVLVPVLLGVPLSRAVGIGVTFSLSSSLYPLLGFTLGAFALKLVHYKKWLFTLSCSMLVIFGMYYIIQGIMYFLD